MPSMLSHVRTASADLTARGRYALGQTVAICTLPSVIISATRLLPNAGRVWSRRASASMSISEQSAVSPAPSRHASMGMIFLRRIPAGASMISAPHARAFASSHAASAPSSGDSSSSGKSASISAPQRAAVSSSPSRQSTRSVPPHLSASSRARLTSPASSSNGHSTSICPLILCPPLCAAQAPARRCRHRA